MSSSVGGAGGGDVEGERAWRWRARFWGDVCGALLVSESEGGSSSRCRLDGRTGFGRALEVAVAVLLFNQGSVRAMFAEKRESRVERPAQCGTLLAGCLSSSLSVAQSGPQL